MTIKKSLTTEELYDIINDVTREIAQLKRELTLSFITVKKLKAKFAVKKIVSKK